MTTKTFPIEWHQYIEPFVGSYPPPEGGEELGPNFITPPRAPFTRADHGDYESKDTTTLTWDADFTPEQEVAWQRLVKRLRRESEALDDDALDPHIAVMKQWRNRPGTANNTQRDAVLDAIVETLRLTLKED